MKNLFFFLSILFITSASAQQPSACGTLLEDISAGTIEELGAEYRRLKSYSNPYCDTTDSDFNKIMNELAKKLVASKSSSEAIIAQLETPYFQGTLAEYEGKKVSVGRDGKMVGLILPPQFKIPAGEYYVVYLWRNQDYLVFALKANKASEFRWWEKGNYR